MDGIWSDYNMCVMYIWKLMGYVMGYKEWL